MKLSANQPCFIVAQSRFGNPHHHTEAIN